MELQLYKTMWGHEGDVELAVDMLVAEGFQGLEGPAPAEKQKRESWRRALSGAGVAYIAEITTAGSYVPRRDAGLEDHLQSFREKLVDSLELSPLFVTCLGGCDAWPEEKSIEFFRRAMEIASEEGAEVCFETHRGRILFNPWVTERICAALPELELTCDFSHWCVVCERLVDSEAALLAGIFERARHIHARVGYDQGPQVADPASPLYENELRAHQNWWRSIWTARARKGVSVFTMTPEFGPDGYQAVDPASGKPIGDLWEMNCWIGEQQKKEFEAFEAGWNQ